MKRSGSPEIVVLHCPPATLDYPPHSPALLGTILNKAGLKVRVIDFNLMAHGIVGRGDHPLWYKINRAQWHDPEVIKPFFEKNKQYFYKILQGICKLEPEAIFIYLDYPNEIIAALIAGLLKEISADQVVIAGGPGGFLPEQQQSINRWGAGAIDSFVPGSSEASCAMNILEALPDICGDETGDLSNPTDVFPTYEGFQQSDYTHRMRAVSWASGCTEKCIFCPLKMGSGGYLCRSFDSILDEIDYHLERKIRDYWVKGSPVNGDPEFLAGLARRIIDSGRRISWAARALPVASLTRELLDLLRRAGCHTLVFCVMTASGTLRERMGMSYEPGVLERVFHDAREAGIKASLDLVTGLPGEYFKEFSATCRFLEKNPHPVIRHLQHAPPLVLFPGTALYEKRDDFLLSIPENDPRHRWSSVDGNKIVVRRNRMRELYTLAGSLLIELGHKTETHLGPSKWHPWHYLGPWMYRLHRGSEPWDAFGRPLWQTILRGLILYLIPVNYVQEQDLEMIRGIRDGAEAFVGPEILHLDLTNRCNMNCIACWDRSPLLNNQGKKDDFFRKSLHFDKIRELIDDLVAQGGWRQLKLSGGGDPSCHADFRKIIQYIRQKDRYVEIDINTNFSLIDEEMCKLLTDLEINLLTVSLWAATPETYQVTHPNQSADSFGKIIDKLRYLVSIRESGLPMIFIHNVLMKQNFREAREMLNLALDIGVEEVHFTLVDQIPGETDSLLLNKTEQQELIKSLKVIKQNTDRFNIYRDPQANRSIKITNFNEFFDKLSEPEVTEGIYDRKSLQNMPCYMGWQYTRIMADGRVVPCCKGHRLPMGNINRKSFRDIWNDAPYRKFRFNGKMLAKDDPYFAVMSDDPGKKGCSNCDNIMHNQVMHDKYLYHKDFTQWLKVKFVKGIKQ